MRKTSFTFFYVIILSALRPKPSFPEPLDEHAAFAAAYHCHAGRDASKNASPGKVEAKDKHPSYHRLSGL
jgi:hypothetical protein